MTTSVVATNPAGVTLPIGAVKITIKDTANLPDPDYGESATPVVPSLVTVRNPTIRHPGTFSSLLYVPTGLTVGVVTVLVGPVVTEHSGPIKTTTGPPALFASVPAAGHMTHLSPKAPPKNPNPVMINWCPWTT